MQSLGELLIPLSIFLPVALIIKIISDNSIRRKLIEKGMVDENVKFLFLKKQSFHPISNIRWGLVLIGIGLPFLIRQVATFDISDEGVIGMMLVFAGIGFVVYYFLAQKTLLSKEDEE
ncbi:hypothetical protein B6I21_05785 [candidate division KSB1 bacterium 4572_119]|nr:MAG: hypothetical protein B6I21_05785 [candidate division KSB1 bacterium 4572_119]